MSAAGPRARRAGRVGPRSTSISASRCCTRPWLASCPRPCSAPSARRTWFSASQIPGGLLRTLLEPFSGENDIDVISVRTAEGHLLIVRTRLVRPRIGVAVPYTYEDALVAETVFGFCALRASSSSGAREKGGECRNRATSSRQPAGESPVRGDARVPGREAPVRGREAGCEAGWNNRPVRSMKRSLQRRHRNPR
jgi:hypothetical protein